MRRSYNGVEVRIESEPCMRIIPCASREHVRRFRIGVPEVTSYHRPARCWPSVVLDLDPIAGLEPRRPKQRIYQQRDRFILSGTTRRRDDRLFVASRRRRRGGGLDGAILDNGRQVHHAIHAIRTLLVCTISAPGTNSPSRRYAAMMACLSMSSTTLMRW